MTDNKNRILEETGIRFTAVSYNIHRCVGVDGRLDPQRVESVLRELDAQIFGLQEVDSRPGGGSPQVEYLARVLGKRAIPDPAIVLPGGYYGNVLLTDCPILQADRIDISFERWEPRSIIDAILDVKGANVRVLVTHFGLQLRERAYQVQRLLELVCRETSIPVIVLGDINEWFPRSRRLQAIHHCLGKTPGPLTFPSRLPLFALDRIWVHPLDTLKNLSVHKTPLSRVASDHLPVKADIEIKIRDAAPPDTDPKNRQIRHKTL